MKIALELSTICIILGCIGCATVQVTPVATTDTVTKGYRYSLPEPYILVTKKSQTSIGLQVTKAGFVIGTAGSNPLDVGRVDLPVGTSVKLTLSDDTNIGIGSKKGKVETVKVDANASLTVAIHHKVAYSGAQPKVLTLTLSVKGLKSEKAYLTIAKDTGNASSIKIDYTPDPDQPGTNFEVKVIYLPNPNRQLAIQHKSRIGGSVELKLTFKDGWMLTSVNSNIDTQADESIAAVGGLFEGVGSLLMALGAGQPAALAGFPQPGLYAPSYGENGIIEGFVRVNFGD